jgi:hypothetical protein
MKIAYTLIVAIFFAACGVKPVGHPAEEISALDERFELKIVGKNRSSALYLGEYDVNSLSEVLEDFKGAGWDMVFCNSDDLPLSADFDVAPVKGDYFLSRSWPEDNGRISLLVKPKGIIYVYYFYSN